ncbi:Protein DENND6B [Toxocara canis]|uniref:Protein DENND6B n=1 Tax=Toxocara canis TaxID=6265 RepID=A0A0B2UTJ7_TOXCA|nr:Protein DENND6B [Toxocara canis]
MPFAHSRLFVLRDIVMIVLAGMEESSELPPWERFGRWVHCICVVTFDLELGQALEVVYPGDAQLSSTEKMNICYLAFPDSNSGCSRDTNFHFRIRRSSSCLNAAQIAYTERVPVAAEIDPVFFYGFVHFRQQRDATLPRGYFQKSLVLITLLPLFNLFAYVVDSVANGFFESGEPAIEAACHHIDQWPSPVPGETLFLPLIGTVIQCRIPCRTDIPLTQTPAFLNVKDTPVAMSTVPEHPGQAGWAAQGIELRDDEMEAKGSVLLCFTNAIVELLELIKTIPKSFLSSTPESRYDIPKFAIFRSMGPIVVIAPSPSVCSSLVQSLISLIWPLRPNVILGVTNPFFTKTLQHWPHIVRVGDASSRHVVNAERTFRKTWDGRTLDTKPGLYTQYKPFLSRDKTLMKKLLKRERPDSVQSAILRRHMLELTQSFMIPLERYLSSLMPLQKQMSPFKAVPQARPFIVDEFLLGLDDTGPALTCGVKGDWNGLYRRFMASKNFEGWLRCRRKDVDRQLRAAHLEVLCNADFSPEVLQGRHQVEIVDLVLKLCDRIRGQDAFVGGVRDRLQSQLATIMQSVDDELKSVLLSNGALSDYVN